MKGKEFSKWSIKIWRECLFDKKWNGKVYDERGNILYELKNGNGKVKEYDDWNNSLLFEREYINGKKWKLKRIL